MKKIDSFLSKDNEPQTIKLLMGPPGCGKTYLAEQRAKQINAQFVYMLCHEELTMDELFMGVNISAAVKGDSENVDQEGYITQACRLSHKNKVVLLLDEIDKAPTRIENNLLDFLQSGIARIRPGEYVQANVQNLEVYMTSNQIREHTEPFLRRCERIFMQPLSNNKIVEILHNKTGLSEVTINVIWKAATSIAACEGNYALSVQEGEYLIYDLYTKCSSLKDVQEVYAARAARHEEGYEATFREKKLQTVWGLVKKGV